MDANPQIPAPMAGAAPDPTGLEGAVAQAFGEAPGIVKAKPDFSNDARLLAVMEEAKRDALDGRWVYERTWWRNILYVLGRQWIYYDKKRGQWVDKRMAKFVPRPVTNKVAEGVESLLAVFGGIQLSALARPIGADPKNIATAEVADRFSPYVHQEHKMDEVLQEADWWLITCGNAFLHPYWDKDERHGMVFVPSEQCGLCGGIFTPMEIEDAGPAGACPGCGRATQWVQGPPGPDGRPIGTNVPRGKGQTDAPSPFEIAVPPIYRKFEDSPLVLRMRFRPKRYYEDNHPDLAKKATWEKAPHERSLQLLRTLATQSDVAAMPLTITQGVGNEVQQEGLTEYELWQRPNPEYPEGLFLRVAGEGPGATIVRDENESCPGPIPSRDQDGKPYIPFIHVSYQPLGGRMWARGPIDPVIQKQDQINQLDSLMQLIVTRVANPVWLEPKGAEVKSFTGEPGLVVKYSPFVAGGLAKPERLSGENIPPTLFQLRDQYVRDFEMMMGTFDVLKGSRPPNVQAFSAMQLLVERAQSRLTTVFKERGRAYQKWYAMALELERAYGPDERNWTVLGPNRGWTFQSFQKANLQGAVDIIVEDGSQTPKTNLGERASIEQAKALGLLDSNDAEQRYSVLNKMGLSYLVPSLDADVKMALREQDAFEKWAADLQESNPQMIAQALGAFQQQVVQYQAVAGQAQAAQAQADAQAAVTGVPGPQVPMPAAPQMPRIGPMQVEPQHGHAIHYAEHRKWGNQDCAVELFKKRPDLKPLYWLHLQEHKAEMMKEALEQAGPGGPGAPPPPPKAGSPLERSNSESGNPHDVPHGTRQDAQRQGPR